MVPFLAAILVLRDRGSAGNGGGRRQVSAEVGGLTKWDRADDLLAEIGRSPGQAILSRRVWADIVSIVHSS